MKVGTYNINGINGRLQHLLGWLAEAEPDVVCLQELKAAPTLFPAQALREAGYGAMWAGEKAYNGVAILTRGGDPVEVRHGLPGDPKDKQARYIEAAYEGVLIACLYLPNGNPQPGPKFDYKLAWFERLIKHAQSLMDAKVPVILAGDFNIVPSDDVADIYSPASWKDNALLQPESREAWQRLLKQGWTDAIAKLHPGEPVYTFWDYMRNRAARDAGLRIDHLLLSKPLAKRLTEAGVDRPMRLRAGSSDHAPAWLRLKEARA